MEGNVGIGGEVLKKERMIDLRKGEDIVVKEGKEGENIMILGGEKIG